jgi:multiple sugar transport system ATP-binding protein
MSFVTLRNVRKSYGEFPVLHGLNASIHEGEFVAILGESGCGKSTLLRMIAGLEDITSGEVEIGGKVVNDLSPRDRDIAMVFQSYALYPHMTVAKNICFPLELAGMSDAEQKKHLSRAADMLNLGDYLQRKPKDLSGGQRQRVAMGRAIVRDPKVFLFDEPLSNLDAKLRVQMRSDIRTLQQELGTTAIYVTHDQIEAMTMADRIMLMNAGKIEQFGPPLDLYDHPSSTFVAAFVGSPPINLIQGEIKSGAQSAFVADGIRVPLPPNTWAAGPVTMGIRPEDISIAQDAQIANAEGRVEAMECTGERTILEVRVGDNAINLSVVERLPLAKGATATLSINPTKCLFFAPNGQAIPAA